MFDFLTNRFSTLLTKLTGSGKLTESNIAQTIETIKDSLLEADVPFNVVNEFIDEVKKEVVGQKVLASLKPGELFIKIVHDKLKSFLSIGNNSIEYTFAIPSTVMVLGLQGSGKTTTLAKLANRVIEQAKMKRKTRRILLASVDFYRPAAIDQLEILAKQIPVDFFRATSTDPVTAAQEIVNHFKSNQYEILFLDTAGRLHIDSDMLQELRALESVVQPKTKLLVLDAMTGQESLAVAQAFEQGVGYQGALLTKLDSETRGGAAFTFGYTQKKPILFLGTGEKIDDLEVFKPDRMASRILGMGDIESLIEKAQFKIKESEQKEAEKALRSGKFSLEDFAKQISMVDKLGSLSSLTKYMPGMGSMSPEMVQKGQAEVGRFKAIISSMTPKERQNHKVLDASRRKRVAAGAGVEVSDINVLIERFEQSQQFVKLFNNGKLKKFFK
ncbi:signal recognition particle protein [bacterium]|mgnify:FL=1|jgi:signal recognition particle subunit SRP54|nr:signal recognition particle protein [bacterium]MBT5015164.1 signal recognition particle protein [bacterium]